MGLFKSLTDKACEIFSYFCVLVLDGVSVIDQSCPLKQADKSTEADWFYSC